MKEVVLKLASIEGVSKDFSGHIKFQLLKFRERLKLTKELDFKSDAQGNVVVDKNMVDTATKLIDLTEPFFLEVSVKHVSGKEAKSFEDLEYDPCFDEIIPVLCSMVLNAGKLGKS
jgi:hypothetical protein